MMLEYNKLTEIFHGWTASEIENLHKYGPSALVKSDATFTEKNRKFAYLQILADESDFDIADVITYPNAYAKWRDYEQAYLLEFGPEKCEEKYPGRKSSAYIFRYNKFKEDDLRSESSDVDLDDLRVEYPDKDSNNSRSKYSDVDLDNLGDLRVDYSGKDWEDLR